MSGEDLVAFQQQRQARRLSQIREHTKTLLATYGGRWVLWEIIADCGVFKASMETSGKVYMYQGMRNIGLKIMDRVTDADDEAFLMMMREAKQREQKAQDEDQALMMDEED